MLKIRNLDSKEFFHPTSDFGTHLYGERDLILKMLEISEKIRTKFDFSNLEILKISKKIRKK